MEMKWMGALFITFGCSFFGFSLASQHIREEALLRQLVGILDYMSCELQFHYTPLPELCCQAGAEGKGPLKQIFFALSQELELQISGDVESSMLRVLRSADLPEKARNNLLLLGSSMGRFDMDGQLAGLEAVRTSCRKDLQELQNDRDNRIRSYQTLGICTGAAIAILLI